MVPIESQNCIFWQITAALDELWKQAQNPLESNDPGSGGCNNNEAKKICCMEWQG